MTRMEPSLAKRFRSGRPCLDFAHTGTTREWSEPELVSDAASLSRWLEHVLGLAEVSSSDADVAPARELREAIWRLARTERPFPAHDVEVLNGFAAAPPPVPRLTETGSLAPASVSAAAALSAIARDAIDLFNGPLSHRIRVCANEGCELMFVDTSRPGTRRWCSMERCGNLAKLRTHRTAKA